LRPKRCSEDKMCYGVKLSIYRILGLTKRFEATIISFVLPEKLAQRIDKYVLLLKNVNIIDLLKEIWPCYIKSTRSMLTVNNVEERSFLRKLNV
jgi:hypothetical protein